MQQETEVHQKKEREKEEMLEVLDEYFGLTTDNNKKFINTERIPLICQDIRNLHYDVKEIKDNLKWITRLIIGAVVLALLGLVLVQSK